jgi:hypothetical protein
MRILGIDCGFKNLAYCLYDSELKAIHTWEVVDISEKSSYIPEKCIEYFDKHLNLLECDRVIIEKQPPRNGKMRVMEAALYCYFILRGKLDESKPISRVETYSAKHKLGGMLGLSGKKSYGARKKAAIHKVMELLGKETDDKWLRYFCEHKKRDDLSDSWLMVLAYIDQESSQQNEPPKRILARKPKDTLKLNEYTPSNIKYILREYQKTNDITGDYLTNTHPELLKILLERYITIEDALLKLKLKL